MNNIFLFVITMFLLPQNLQSDSYPNSLSFRIGFYPSRSSTVFVNLNQHGKHGYITMKTFDFRKVNKVISSDSVLLDEHDFSEFFKKLKGVSLLNIPSKSLDQGKDGIDIVVNVLQDNKSHTFSDWSPDRKGDKKLYIVLDDLFYMLTKHFPKAGQGIMSLQHYFDYRITNVNGTFIKL